MVLFTMFKCRGYITSLNECRGVMPSERWCAFIYSLKADVCKLQSRRKQKYLRSVTMYCIVCSMYFED